MTPVAVDYATGRPSPTALRAAGATGVIRYLSWLYDWAGVTHNYVNPKVIQAPEFTALHNAGLDVTLNWEYDALDWLTGAGGGTAHATEAVRQARLLGYPKGSVILGSADLNMTYQQWSTAGANYAAAFARTLGGAGYRPGVYGPYDVLTWCRQTGLFGTYWQAGMATAWSGGRNAQPWPGAHLRQVHGATIDGVACDVSEILIPDYGQYGGSTVTQPTRTIADEAAIAITNGSAKWTTPAGTSMTNVLPDWFTRLETAVAQIAADVAAIKAVVGAPAVGTVAAIAAVEADIAAKLTPPAATT